MTLRIVRDGETEDGETATLDELLVEALVSTKRLEVAMVREMHLGRADRRVDLGFGPIQAQRSLLERLVA